jgi:acetyltransferase-like isoleucine patch superfamily enzyme
MARLLTAMQAGLGVNRSARARQAAFPLPAVGTRVHRAARTGVSAIIVQPAVIGEQALVGAAALVRDDVPPRTVVVGIPAVPLRRVRDDELLDTLHGAVDPTSPVMR